MPAVVDTLKSNADQGLTVISLQGQNQRDDVSDDHWVGVGKEMGMQHAMGDTSYFGEYSAYFNLNKNPSTTYGFIIGRSGVLRWHGDMGSGVDEYYEALSEALAVPAVPSIPGADSEELSRALLQVVAGDYSKAIREASKVRDKQAKRKKPEAQALSAQAGEIAAALVKFEETLIETARDAREGKTYAQAARSLRRYFPKSAHHKELKRIEKAQKKTPELVERIAAWHGWFDLASERPMTFPARHDKENKRFARRLEKFLSRSQEGPGSETARAWLARWEAPSSP